MKIEIYNPQDYLPLEYFPWPNDINPHLEQMTKDFHRWLDEDYTFLSEENKKRYKRMQLDFCNACMVPYTDYRRVTPYHRFMVFHTIFDDQMEFATREEISRHRVRLVDIFRGAADPTPEDNALYRQAAIIRDEFSAFMPEIWIQRLAEEFHRVTRYGNEEEQPFKNTGTAPSSLARFKILREYSVIFTPYPYFVDVQTGFVMPEEIHEHPVIQRLRSLSCRLIAWQNDIHSLLKELRMKSETMNLVIFLMRRCNLSLEDALAETMRTIDEDIAEYEALRADLPDFGEDQQEVEQFLLILGAMVQGVNTFYQTTTQYHPDGFAYPEEDQEKI